MKKQREYAKAHAGTAHAGGHRNLKDAERDGHSGHGHQVPLHPVLSGPEAAPVIDHLAVVHRLQADTTISRNSCTRRNIPITI